jgi:hypothetical protein
MGMRGAGRTDRLVGYASLMVMPICIGELNFGTEG